MESYNIGSGLTLKAEDDNRSDEEYYKEESTAMINNRLVKAGYRLGYLLNTILTPPPIIDYSRIIPNTLEYKAEKYYFSIPVKRAWEFTGIPVSVKSRVYGVKDMITTAELYLGAGSPNQNLTIMLSGKAKDLVNGIDGKTITAKGEIFNRNALPEMDISNPADIDIK